MAIPEPLITGRVVTYELPLHEGRIFIKVMLELPTPRVMIWAFINGRIEPISIFFDDLDGYVRDAKGRVGT